MPAILTFAVLVLCLTFTAFAEIKTETVEYKDGDVVLEGYIAWDSSIEGKRPGILVVHQWKGLSDHEKRKARHMAKLGYVALAVDIYGKGVRPKTQQEAGATAGKYKGDRKLLRQRILAGLTSLKANAAVDTKRIAAIGFCFGGTTVLELARSGADVKGVVSFHGGLDSPAPEDAKNIKASVMVCHGNDDPYVKDDEVAAFMKEMRDAKVDYQFLAYANTVHSFTHAYLSTDNSRGAAYNAKADHRSWEAMKVFFTELFGEAPNEAMGTGAQQFESEKKEAK